LLIDEPASDVQRALGEMREEMQKQNGVISSLLETVSRQAAKITHLEKQLHDVTDKSRDPSSLPDAVPGYSNFSQASAGERGDTYMFYEVQRAKTLLLYYIRKYVVQPLQW